MSYPLSSSSSSWHEFKRVLARENAGNGGEGGWCPADRREYDTCSLSYCTVSYCTLPYCNTLALSYCNALALSYRNALELYVQYTYTVRAILLHCVILQYTAVTFCTALSNYITVTYCSELPCINILLCSVKLQCISQQFRQLHANALHCFGLQDCSNFFCIEAQLHSAVRKKDSRSFRLQD